MIHSWGPYVGESPDVNTPSAPTPGTTTLALHGEYRLESEDVEQAVADLNSIYSRKGLETALELGRHLLDRYFGGDPENFRGRSRSHVSFRALAGTDDLAVSYSWLSKAVAVVEQVEQLPQDVAMALPVAHHTLLLSLRDLDTKSRLAGQAV